MSHLRSATAMTLALLVLGTSLNAQGTPDLATPIKANLAGQTVPTGMRITPEAMPGSVFSTLNPNLPGLPNFLAGLARTVALGHEAGVGVAVMPQAAGLAVSPDGSRLLIANYQNESVSLIDTAAHTVLAELDLRPGIIDAGQTSTPGGTYPNLVAWVGDGKAYVTSQRDRELIVVDVAAKGLSVGSRAAVNGQPASIVMNADATRAYLALDNTDRVVAVDTGTDRIVEEIAAAPPEVWRNPSELYGANTNGLALSSDGMTLYATNGGLNAVAVIALGTAALDEATIDDAEEAQGDEVSAEAEEEEEA